MGTQPLPIAGPPGPRVKLHNRRAVVDRTRGLEYVDMQLSPVESPYHNVLANHRRDNIPVERSRETERRPAPKEIWLARSRCHSIDARNQEFRVCHSSFAALDALQLLERDFVRVPPIGTPCAGGRSYVRARQIAAVVNQLGRSL
jgi:hypothetical protein